jgi:cytidyltransferase-like protein
MKTGLFIGRFQPFHEGHRKCVEHILAECTRAVVLVRDGIPDKNNPMSYAQREAVIRAVFPSEFFVGIQRLPDPNYDLCVYVGREVGYETIKLDAGTEAISATKIRNGEET